MKSLKFILFNTLTFIVLLLIASRFIQVPKKQTDVSSKIYETQISLTQNYQKCGHIVTDNKSQRVSYSSEDELLRRFEDYTITSSNSEKIVLTKNIKGYCPSHFIAVLNNNKITITSLFDAKTVAVIKTFGLSLSEHEKKLLTEGLTIDSEEALSSFIEDFTS